MMMVGLFDWQVKALERLHDLKAAAIFAGLGTGKSRVVFEDAKEKGAALAVVCPKTAIGVWLDQRQRWGYGVPMAVLNYERTWRTDVLTKWIAEQRRAGWLVMVVLDEAHKIKDRTTKQSKACRKLGQLADYRRILTGTPVLNGYHDLWAQYNFLIGDWPDMELWAHWKKFAEEHLIFNPVLPSKVEAVRNVPVLRQQLAPFTIHVRTDDVLDLPAQTDLERSCVLGSKARKVYDDLEAQLYAEIDEHSIRTPITLVKLLRLAQIAGGFVHAADDATKESHVLAVDTAKLDLLRDVIEEIGPDEKFVIFCRFTAERQAIGRLMQQMGRTNTMLYGGQTDQERTQNISAFRGPGGPQALVANLQVGSASIDLTAARYAIYYSVGFSFGDYEQSRGRIRRHGQKRPQFYVHLIAEDTIDTYIRLALRNKQGASEAVRQWWEDQHDD